MGGVDRQAGQLLLAVPETEHLEPGVDGPLGLLAELGVACGAGPAELHSPVQHKTPIGGDILDLGLSHADVADPTGRLQPLAQHPADALHRLLVELQIADGTFRSCRLQQALGFQIDDRSVVLMDAADHDPLRRRPGSFGQDGTPAVISVIADLAPVHHGQHNRLARAKQDQTVNEQGILDAPGRSDAAAHQRMLQRHGHLGLKRRQTQPLLLCPGHLPGGQTGCHPRENLTPTWSAGHFHVPICWNRSVDYTAIRSAATGKRREKSLAGSIHPGYNNSIAPREGPLEEQV